MGASAWKRIAGLLWIAVVAGFIVHEARELEWAEVWSAVQGYGWPMLAIAALIGFAGYAACASYDLIGRHCTGHEVSVGRTVAMSFVGYCFSLNLGALIGGVAFRYRLYASCGLAPWKTGQVIALSVLTNWSGYAVLGGLLFTFFPPSLPVSWHAPEFALRGAGIGMLVASALYVWYCTRRGGERVRWRGRELMVPTVRVAAVQFALSLVSWSAIGAVIAWLLTDGSWLVVMPVLLTSAVVGVISHVPGGIGVVEMVFAVMLGDRVARPELIAALLAFRATYYLLPLLLAVLTYLYLEITDGAPDREFAGSPSVAGNSVRSGR